MKPFIVTLKISKHKTQEINLFGLQQIQIKTFQLQEPGGDILFEFNSHNTISICIKQLEEVKWEIMQLLKDYYNINKYEIDWEKHISPIIKNNNLRQIITF
jgi:hypothetical protein